MVTMETRVLLFPRKHGKKYQRLAGGRCRRRQLVHRTYGATVPVAESSLEKAGFQTPSQKKSQG